MARIPLTSGFTLIPEGKYIFRIYEVQYDEDFGKIQVKMVNAQGLTHTERFTIKQSNNEPNEKALGAFSYFAKTALNDFTREDIDPEELVDHYIEADIIHNKVQSTQNPDKLMTFANLGDKSPAVGFTDRPVEKALSLGKENKATSGFNLDELLR